MSLSSKLLTAGAFLSFFAFGFIDNLKGPLLPEILRVEKMSYAQGGTFFLAAYVGFIVATLASGVLADMLSNRRVLLLSAICLLSGAGGLNATTSLPLLNLSMGIIGLGLGGIEVGANGLMVELHSASRARYLNLLATFHGVGSLLVPLVAAWPHSFCSSRVNSRPVLRLCRTLPVAKSTRRFSWSVRIVFSWSLKVGLPRVSV